MPRTSRYTVEFDAAGHHWLVETAHQHAIEKCLHKPECLHTIGDPKKGAQRQVIRCAAMTIIEPVRYEVREPLSVKVKQIAVKHITTVTLRHKDHGTRSAVFTRGQAPCSLLDDYNWRKGIHLALQRALEKAGFCQLIKGPKGILVTNRKPEYSEITEAFWRESKIKNYSPDSLPAKLLSGGSTRALLDHTKQPSDHAYIGKAHGMGFTGD